MKKFPLFSPKKTEYFLSLDIGRETVKAIVFCVTKEKESKRITILGNATQYLDALDKVLTSLSFSIAKSVPIYGADNGSLLQEARKTAILKTIEEAVNNAESNSKKNKLPNSLGNNLAKRIKKEIQSAIIGLSADILKGKIHYCCLSRNHPNTLISEEEAEEIRLNVLRETKERVSQLLSRELGFPLAELHLVSYRIIEIKIDGYEVPDLCDYKGKILEFKALTAVLAEGYFADTIKIIQDYKKFSGNISKKPSSFKTIKIVHLAESLSDYLRNKKANGLFLDIGGNWTHIFLVNDGKITYINEFEFGGAVFSQSISERFGLEISQARILKEDYSKKLLSEGVRAKLREIIWQDAEVWFRNLKQNLREIPCPIEENNEEDHGRRRTSRLLPREIFLFGGGSELPEMAEILEEGDWEGMLISPPQVKLFYPADIADQFKKNQVEFEDLTKNINSPRNTDSISFCYYEQ